MFYILKVTSRCRLLLSVLVIVSLDCCRARYRLGGVLPVTIDRISPFNSPYETYTNGLVLPFCEHRTNKTQALSFSKIFQGDNVRPSVYNISYQRMLRRCADFFSVTFTLPPYMDRSNTAVAGVIPTTQS